MTISSEIFRSGPYAGNGVTRAFDYKFKIVSADHLRVAHTNAASVETIMVRDRDYTVTGVGNEGGGQAILTTPLPDGEKVTILFNVPFTQETDLENQGPYQAEVVEAALDLIVMRLLQLKEQASRAVTVPAYAADADLEKLAGDILLLGARVENLDALAAHVKYLPTVAAIAANISRVAMSAANVDIVAAREASITKLAGSAGDIDTLAAIATKISRLAESATSIDFVNYRLAEINTVAGHIAQMLTVAGIASSVSQIASIAAQVNTVSGKISDVSAVAAIAGTLGTAPELVSQAIEKASAAAASASQAAASADRAALWNPDGYARLENPQFLGKIMTPKTEITGPYGYNLWASGTGDGASFSTYNTVLGSWWGLGFQDTSSGAINGVMDLRAGILNMRGGFQVYGQTVWHAGNDGAGSGLDADMLDGQHGSFFRNASNLENGTVPDERLPARLRFSAELITDWNDAQSNGWYRGDPAALNSPAAGEWWIGEVQLNEYNAWVFQKVHSFTSGGVETYRRVMQAGIWKPWRRVYETEAEIREASKMVSLPAVPATGTAIDWTSIPAGVEEIELWFDGISINGTSGLLVQVGTGGVLQTSGYQSGSYLGGNTRQTSTSGITIRLDTAFYLKTGVLRLVRSSDNRWLSYHVVGDVTTGYTVMGGGHVTLTGGLDTIRLRAVDAAQTLDAGSVQLRYRR